MQKPQLIEIRSQGLSYAQIGKQAGISRQRVHQILTGYKPKLTERSKLKQKEQSRKHSAERRRKYPHLIQQQNRDINYHRKVLVITHYGNGKAQCIRCSFNDMRALTIDHIKACGNQNRELSGRLLYHYLIKHHYPQGFQTLCMNCQWIKRHENKEFGWQSSAGKKILDNRQFIQTTSDEPQLTLDFFPPIADIGHFVAKS